MVKENFCYFNCNLIFDKIKHNGLDAISNFLLVTKM